MRRPSTCPQLSALVLRAIALAGLLFPSLSMPGCAPAAPRNLVLISLDTLAPERMSTYGNPRATTPAVSALAADGVVFTRAYSSSSWTLPAHASMLTGRYPAALSYGPGGPLGAYRAAPLLSQLFQAQGYRTGAVTGGGFVSAAFGVDRGFDFFQEVPEEPGSAPAAAGVAAQWLEGQAGEPFFLFFHTYLPHALYLDRRFATEPGLSPGRLEGSFATAGRALDQAICCGEGVDLSPAEREYLLALYDSDIAAADEEVGRLLAALERLGVRDRTTVIVTSDHGEEFWQHTGWAVRHGHTLYDELLRVPLVWYEPGLEAAGTACDVPVNLVDLVPTLVSRFGLSPPEQVDGIDLDRVLEACTGGEDRALFAEGVRDGAARYSVRTSRGKLIETPRPDRQHGLGKSVPVPVRARRELYLPGDVAEQENAIEAHPALADQLSRLLRAHDPRAGTEAEGPPPSAPLLDERTRERLKELGYVP